GSAAWRGGFVHLPPALFLVLRHSQRQTTQRGCEISGVSAAGRLVRSLLYVRGFVIIAVPSYRFCAAMRPAFRSVRRRERCGGSCPRGTVSRVRRTAGFRERRIRARSHAN